MALPPGRVKLEGALPQVPDGHYDRATQQPVVAIPAASWRRAPGVRVVGNHRPPHRCPRYTLVGNGLTDDTFWLVAAHGPQADYVRNLQANQQVRVKIGCRWRSGTAVLLPGDDTAARSRALPYRWDAAIGRAMASAPLTIRIDLDPD